MPSVPFALSLHGLFDSVGRDAGFAAIAGLAVLVLLFFAHAREMATLRERLDEAGRWIESLEARLGQLQRAATTGPAPTPRPDLGQGTSAAASRTGSAASGPPTTNGSLAGQPAVVPLPGAPAGTAAPALAAATRLIPAGPPSGSNSGTPVPAAPAPASSAPATVPASIAPATAAASVGPGAAATSLGPATAAASAVPATAAGTATRPVGAPPSAARSAEAAPSAPPRLATTPVGAGARTASAGGTGWGPVRLESPPRRRSRGRRLIPVLIGLAAVAAIVAALVVLTGPGTSSTVVHSPRRLSKRSEKALSARVDPAKVTVAVLNGTDVTNLAHDVASRLASDGFHEGTVATASNQTFTSTVVGYFPGRQAEARRVAEALSLNAASVKPVDQQATGVACPGASASSGCNLDIIVTVGSNLSGLASNQTAPSG